MAHTRCINEVWKDIEGYEGLYKVSNFGRVKSCEKSVRNSKTGYRTVKEKILKTWEASGYFNVSLCKNCISKNFQVHRLVAEAFISNPNNKPFVNHIDCDPHNNNVNNLEWCTPKENTDWCIKMGRFKSFPMTEEKRKEIGKKGTKPIISINLQTGEKLYFESQSKAAKQLNLSVGTINNVLKNRSKQYNGYIFKYADEDKQENALF